MVIRNGDRPCGLVVRVPGYRSKGPGFVSQCYQLRSSGSGTGSTQPWGSIVLTTRHLLSTKLALTSPLSGSHWVGVYIYISFWLICYIEEYFRSRMLNNKHFYVYITSFLKVSDDTTIGSAKSKQWPLIFSDLNPFDYHVWNNLKKLVYKSQREPFQSPQLLEQRI
jgi:hypothetical protein